MRRRLSRNALASGRILGRFAGFANMGQAPIAPYKPKTAIAGKMRIILEVRLGP